MLFLKKKLKKQLYLEDMHVAFVIVVAAKTILE